MLNLSSIIPNWIILYISNSILFSLLCLISVTVIFIIIGITLGFILKNIFIKLIYRWSNRLNSLFFKSILDSKIATLIILIVTSLSLQASFHFTLFENDKLSVNYNAVISSVVHALNFILTALFINRILTVVNCYYNEKYASIRNKEIYNYLKVISFIVWCVTLLLYVSYILNKSPLTILTGIGAISAFFLVIFKDTILGLAAGVQTSANNVAKIGDWVVLPQHDIDGKLIAMSISTIKVLNWDNTISTLPAYSLINGQVKNWQNVFNSGGRRFIRNINIDIESITTIPNERVNYLVNKYQLDINQLDIFDQSNNLLLYKQYVQNFLKNHHKINQDMTVLARLMDTTMLGVPLQIYAFSKDVAWIEYEKVQSDIFARLLIVLQDFNLKVVQVINTQG